MAPALAAVGALAGAVGHGCAAAGSGVAAWGAGGGFEGEDFGLEVGEAFQFESEGVGSAFCGSALRHGIFELRFKEASCWEMVEKTRMGEEVRELLRARASTTATRRLSTPRLYSPLRLLAIRS